jgi:hypothetical protein
MEVEEEKGEEAGCVMCLSRMSKLGINEDALFEYFNTQLKEMTQCPNKRCTCLVILGDASARASVAKYLTWFEQRNKYEQDSIVFKWFRYSSFLKPSTKQKEQIIRHCFVYLTLMGALQLLMRWYTLICFARLVCKEFWHLAKRGMDQSGMLRSLHL